MNSISNFFNAFIFLSCFLCSLLKTCFNSWHNLFNYISLCPRIFYTYCTKLVLISMLLWMIKYVIYEHVNMAIWYIDTKIAFLSLGQYAEKYMTCQTGKRNGKKLKIEKKRERISEQLSLDCLQQNWIRIRPFEKPDTDPSFSKTSSWIG